jgi:hypothetical protein
MTDLFILGTFRSHSGIDLGWKIDADALTDADLATLAKLVADRITFSRVIGIPRGGLRFAAALKPYCATPPISTIPITLVVDDVLTTGRSMEEVKAGIIHSFDSENQPVCQILGVVIFARAVPPYWVRPIFSLAPWVQP